MKYRKKPIVVEAIQWDGTNYFKLIKIFSNDKINHDFAFHDQLIVKTPEGDLTVNVGDYIIRGIKGELYPCRQDIFAETYEVVDES